MAIRHGNENDAKLAVVTIMDEWAADVIVAHLGTRRFPLQVLATFTKAERTGFMGILGDARGQPPEVLRWVLDCNRLMADRLRYWADRSASFQPVAVQSRNGYERPS